MKSIAIYGSMYQEGYFSQIQHLLDCIVSAELDLYMWRPLAEYLVQHSVALPDVLQTIDEFEGRSQCVISLGGDGTFLRTAEWVGPAEVPILGINTGHLGFLACYSLGESEQLVALIAGDMGQTERRSLLKVECDALPPDFWPYALNEVAVMKGETASMVTLRTDLDGHFLADYAADGLIVSTPTGSTAYNLSVGGPVVQPSLSCMILSPIAPHTLTMRPLVVSGKSTICIEPYSRVGDCRVSLDGRSFMIRASHFDANQTPLPNEESDICDRLTISKAPFSIVILRRPDNDFSSLLRTKLRWSLR